MSFDALAKKVHRVAAPDHSDDAAVSLPLDAGEGFAPALTGDSWTATAGGDWSDGGDWSTGTAPTSSTAATIGAAGTYTVTVTTPDAAGSLAISQPGVTVDDSGTLSIGSTVKISAGTFILDYEGSLVGGTVSLGSTATFAVQGGTLSGVTYDGTLNNTSGYNLYLTGADAFAGSNGSGAGTINLSGSSLLAEGKTTLSGAVLDLGGTATIYLDADDVGTAATLTLASTTSLVTAAGGLYEIDLYDYTSTYSGTLINQGTITCTNSEGNPFTVYGAASDVFVNEGKVSAGSGGTLVLETNITGAGGSFAVASGGTLLLDGGYTLNNTGGTLSIASGGVFDLSGAVGGGTIIDTNGGLTSSYGALNGVAYHGTLNVNNGNQELYLTGTNTFAGSGGTGAGVIDVNGGDYLFAEGTTTLNGATLNFGNASSADQIYVDGRDSGSNATLTLGSALNLVESAASSYGTIDLYSYSQPSYTGTLINQGTITASASGGNLVIYGGPGDVFINTGKLAISNGDALILDANVSGLGSFTTASGGELLVNNTVSNSGSTISLGSGSQLTLAGVIAGGTIKDSGGGLVADGGTLSGVAYDGTLSLPAASSDLYMTGTESLSGTAGTGAGVINLTAANDTIYAEGSTTINGATINAGTNGGNVVFIYADGADVGTNATLTLGSTTNLVHATAGGGMEIDLSSYTQPSYTGTLINQGTITASASGGNLLIYGPGASDVFVDPGKMAISNNSSIELAVNVSGGLGSFTTTTGGALTLDNGYTISNAGATLSLSTGSQLTLAGAITGGTIKDSGGGLIADGGRLSGVSYQGTLSLTTANCLLYLLGADNFSGSGGTGTGVINLTGASASIYAEGSTTLNGATLNFGSANSVANIYGDGSDAGTNSTLTLGSTLDLVESAASSTGTIDLYDANGASYTGTLINQGTITASASGGELSIYGQPGLDVFTNTGKIAVSNTDTLLLEVNVGTAGLGSFTTASGGVLELSSGYTISNTGATLSLSTGSQLTLAGTIAGGTIKDSGGGLVSDYGLLSGVSYQGTLDLTGSNYLYLLGTENFSGTGGTGTGVINLTGPGAVIYAEGSTTLNGATVNFGNATTATYIYVDGADSQSNATLTLGSTLNLVQSAAGSVGRIDLYSQNGTSYTGTLINQGTITASASGGNFSIYGQPGYDVFTNTGKIAVSNTDVFDLQTNVSTAGLGSFTTTTGGVLKLSSGYTISNTGATLSLGTGSQLTLAGTIAGGTIKDSGGGLIGDGGLLSGVAYQGTLSLTVTNSYLYLLGTENFSGSGGTGAGVINLTGAGASFNAEGSTTLNGATVNFGNAAGTTYIYGDGYDTATNSTLTLGSTLDLVQSAAGSYAEIDLYDENGSSYKGTLINQGTITASASAGSFEIYGVGAYDVFSNTGKIAVSNTDTVSLSINLTTAGLGSFTTATGGVLLLSGGYTLSNTGATLSLGTGNQLTLSGEILGGTIQDSGGGLISDSGILSGVTYLGTLGLTSASEVLHVYNGLNVSTGGSAGIINVTGSGATLDFEGNETINNASITLGSSNNAYITSGNSVAGTLTFGSNLSITAVAAAEMLLDQGQYAGAVINQGTITASGGSGVLYIIDYDKFTNTGTLAASNGGSLDLTGLSTFGNFAGNTLTGGTFEATANSTLQLTNNTYISTDAATLILSGTASTIQSVQLSTGNEITLDQKLATIASTGALELLAGRNYSAAGSFTDAGKLQLGGGTFTATSAGLTLASTGTLSGFGTAKATIADAGLILASGGTLALAGTVTGAGSLQAAAGATLDLTAGGTIAQPVSGAGTLKLDGTKAYALSTGSTLGISTVQIDTGITLAGPGTIAGAVADAGTLSVASGTLAVDGAVTGAGVLSAATGAVLDLLGGGAFAGAISGAGTLRLDGSTLFTLQAGATLSAASVVVDEGATLDLTQGGSLPQNVSGAGTLQLDGTSAYTLGAESPTVHTLLVDTAATLSTTGTIVGGLVDDGTLSVPAGTLALDGALSGTGTIVLATGATLDLLGGGTLGEGVSGAGAIRIDSAVALNGDTLAQGATLVDAGGTLSGSGSIAGGLANAGTVAASGGTLALSGALSGTGSFVAEANGVLALSGGGALTEVFAGAGALQLGSGTYTLAGETDAVAAFAVLAGATLSGFGTLAGNVNDAGTLTATGGVLDLSGGGLFDGTVNGTGTLQLAASTYTLGGGALATGNVAVVAGATLSGTGTISGALADAGTVSASGGTLKLATVSGTGSLQAGGGAVLDLTVGGALTEVFGGAGILQLDGGTYTLAGQTLAISAVTLDSGATLSGYGTLSGALTDSGSLAVGGGTLSVLGAYSGAGAASLAANATLDLLDGGSLAGSVSGAGTLQLDRSATTTLTAKTLSAGTVKIDSGADLSGAGTNTVTGAVSDAGVVSAASGTLNLGGVVSGGGTLLAAAGAELHLEAGGTLSTSMQGAGTLLLDGAYGFAGTTAFTVAHLTIDYGASLSGTGTIASAINVAGTLTASAGTLVATGAVAGNGTLQATAGSVLDLTASGTLPKALIGAGTVKLDGPSYTYGTATTSSVATLAVDSGAQLAGAGSIASTVVDSGIVDASGGTLVLNGAVSGTGHLEASASAVLDLTSSGTLTEAISGAGTLALGGAATLGASAPTIAAIAIGAAGSLSGAGTLTSAVSNLGTIGVGSFTLSFLGAVTNSGLASASGGLLSFKDTVSGTGTLAVGATGTLALLSGAGSGQTVDFLASSGAVDLAHPSSLLGAISGFAGSDTIDLVNTLANGFTYAPGTNGGVLTLTDNGSTIGSLTFDGAYGSTSFSLVTDGHGGTAITFV